MRPEERTLGLLWDMQDNARFAAEIAEGITLERLRASRKDQLALAKAIEVVGEAAHQLPDGFRALHPEIPWHDIINLRHRIDNELPSLIEWVDRQLAAAPPEEDDPEP